ncbi:phosphonate ABC transporter, permease protein PhnE [Muricoccus aerilatus]|uniref:phosphonate ABC transporter, permease protein PhnE n=1 Tax=Muricoccus aerilatus TaxID=452982 RepID=UPI0005C19710|nr:phosphonate ABC transporter, permease protein PhnE [Roseomonas aerilata]
MSATFSPAALRGEAAFQAARRAKRARLLLGGALFIIALLAAAEVSEFYPSSLAAGLPRAGDYFARLVPDLRWASLFGGWETEGSIAFWFYRLDKWALLLVETANMAALATLAGGAVALLLSFPAARNVAPSSIAYQLSRRVLEAMRTVPEIVYALILVWAFGVGPLAGILAIAAHTTGALGKLFAEAVENAEMGPWEGVRAAGGTWAQACRFAMLPQVAPNMVSYLLLRFEINVRGASVIGFVGAGGIGQELYLVISQNYYEEISAIIVLIVLVVAMIDLLSDALRRRLRGEARA